MNKPWNSFPSLQIPVDAQGSARRTSGNTKATNRTYANRAAIIGAGLAGCWLARILAEQGIAVTLYERQTSVASAASGNPAGIAKPFVTRDASLAMSFHCIAHKLLLDRLQRFNLTATAEFTACGVLQLVEKPFPTSTNFASLTALEASNFAGVPLKNPALKFASAGWLNPKQLCCDLVAHPLITLHLEKDIIAIEDLTTHSTDNFELNRGSHKTASNNFGLGCSHQLKFKDGEFAYAEHVVLTTGAATSLLLDIPQLPINAARGQISRFSLSEKSVSPKCVVNGKHYVIPDGRSVLVGATFQRDKTDTKVSANDHAANLKGLSQLLPTLNVDPQAIAGYVGVRATTPDRLPIVGPLPDFRAAAEIYGDLKHGRSLDDYPKLPCRKGIYVISGLGSRGIVTAPLCAQLLADHLTQRTENNESGLRSKNNIGKSPTDINYGSLESWAPLTNPARFLIRHLKRSK